MTTSALTERFSRRGKALTWCVPVAVAGAVCGIAVLAAAGPSDATPTLPTRTAAQLITEVQRHADTPLSGQVAESADLGLPSLPGEDSAASLSWQTFLTGSHTFRVWADGPQRQRAALLGQLSEADVVHNGRDVWTYTSDTNAVSHTVLPADRQPSDGRSAEAYNPAAVATSILKAIDPSTSVTVESNRYVAGRSAYVIQLAPRSGDSTVDKVTVAIDARKFVPLELAVYPAGSSPAVRIGFSKVSFARPAASVFDFRRPAGSSISTDPFGASRTGRPGDRPSPGARAEESALSPTVLGTAWTSVLEVHSARMGSLGLGDRTLQELTTAVGSSGNRLLQTRLINALFLPDGRAFVGAVKPAALERLAANTPH
jgi:outer membrane lipoprotein-sorting protein